MFLGEQIEALEAPLGADRVSKRKAGNGMVLDYLEGWDVIDRANTIFGYGMWDQEIVKLEEVVDQLEGDYTVVGYAARVRITVRDEDGQCSSHEDVGLGNGKSKRAFDAHELAQKEAVTDAMKRAFRAFGNQFGNSLYDKQRRGVEAEDSQVEVKVEVKAKKPVGKKLAGDDFISYGWGEQPKGAVRISKDRFAMVGDIEDIGSMQDILHYNRDLLDWYKKEGKTASCKYAEQDIKKIERKLKYLLEEQAKQDQ